jgi:hypothetical protein
MGTSRKEKHEQDRLLTEASTLLGPAQGESNGTDTPFAWKEKIKKKIKTKDKSYLRGWLKVSKDPDVNATLKKLWTDDEDV